jgi:hypothetical protein
MCVVATKTDSASSKIPLSIMKTCTFYVKEGITKTAPRPSPLSRTQRIIILFLFLFETGGTAIDVLVDRYWYQQTLITVLRIFIRCESGVKVSKELF